jgi:hypothetical protein
MQDTLVKGGKWIKPPGDAAVTYVVHPEHIKRLFSEGGEPVSDPRPLQAIRVAQAEVPPMAPGQSALDAALQEIARLRVELEKQQALAIPDITGMVKDAVPREQIIQSVPGNRVKR